MIFLAPIVKVLRRSKKFVNNLHVIVRFLIYLKFIFANEFLSLAFLGWSEYGPWSECNEDGERSRFRKCLVEKPGPKDCRGNERDVRSCNALPINGILH